MADKQFRSKLFQAQPNQLLLDERVSKIVLPSAKEMETEALDPENLAILMEEDSEESEDEGVLQIFVGSATSEVRPTETWEISEDEDPFFEPESSEDEDATVVIPLQISAQIPPAALVPDSAAPSQERTSSVEASASQDFEDEWAEIDWDDVTLSDILGESDAYFDDSDEDDDRAYGDSLGVWLDETIPEPRSLGQTQDDDSGSSKGFSFDALFNDEFSSEFDPLEDISQEHTKETTAERVSFALDDELPEIQVETEWWQHPILVFFVALLGVMTVFMLLLQLFGK